MQNKEDIELGGVEDGGTCAAFDQEKASGGSCPAQIIVKKKLTHQKLWLLLREEQKELSVGYLNRIIISIIVLLVCVGFTLASEEAHKFIRESPFLRWSVFGFILSWIVCACILAKATRKKQLMLSQTRKDNLDLCLKPDELVVGIEESCDIYCPPWYNYWLPFLFVVDLAGSWALLIATL